MKLLKDVGKLCQRIERAAMKDLPSTNVQCDELWSFIYAKQKNVPSKYMGKFGYGHVWTWTAIDMDSKLLIAWYLGRRNKRAARKFMHRLRSRLRYEKVYIATDAYVPYSRTIRRAFGYRHTMNHAETALVERHNLTPMRTSLRRYTRKTNAFSKKMTGHLAALYLYSVWYNFCRIHQSLEGKTPAQVAGIVDTRFTAEMLAKHA